MIRMDDRIVEIEWREAVRLSTNRRDVHVPPMPAHMYPAGG